MQHECRTQNGENCSVIFVTERGAKEEREKGKNSKENGGHEKGACLLLLHSRKSKF